jgi:1-acyl-sn-glycerol-3-phosphate acyltransferase
MSNIIPKFFNFECFGMENLTNLPPNSSVILAGNHRSHLDGLVAFSTIFPPVGNRRYITTITPGSVLQENFLFKFMRYLGGFPLDRENPDLSLDYLYESLKVGLTVGIFPQGGRVARTPIEDYQKFSNEGRSGVGRLVLRMKGKTPVIPFYIHGTAEALGRGSIKPKFGSYISVTLGKPIYYPDYKDKEWDRTSSSFHETARTVTNNVMKKIQELCYETEKGIFGFFEKKFNLNLDDIKLSEFQSKKLQKWLRRYSHYAPYDFLN